MLRRSILLAVATALLAAPCAQAAAAPAAFRPFAPDSLWNLPLRDDAPLHARSATWTRWLAEQVRTHRVWFNSTSCGMPMYWAAPGTREVRVDLHHPSYMDPALIRAWSQVPIPAHARPARCGDKNFAVLQRQTDGTVRQWEFWAARKRANGTWVAEWGGATQDVARDRGVASPLSWRDPSAPEWLARAATPGWNVTASSVSMTAGVITLRDLRRGRIDHAVAMAVPDARKWQWLWPAQRSDGGLDDPRALPQGARLRLDPALDVDALDLPPLVKMVARAAQRHGIVVRDRTGSVSVLYAEEPPRGRPDPFAAALRGQWADAAFARFPWDRLRVLDAPTCTDWRGCVARPRVAISADGDRRAGRPLTLDTTNSLLDQPREDVRWDLDGDGSFETAAGRAVKRTVALPAGRRTVSVRIVMRDGKVATGSRTLDIAP